jgi:hypothetical protein
MPVPWLTVLQNVPWSDVLKNAPKVADGARKLWSSVGKKPQPTSPEVAVPAAASPEVQTIAVLGRASVPRNRSPIHAQMRHRQLLDPWSGRIRS